MDFFDKSDHSAIVGLPENCSLIFQKFGKKLEII